jgi:hypothetical protein
MKTDATNGNIEYVPAENQTKYDQLKGFVSAV